MAAEKNLNSQKEQHMDSRRRSFLALGALASLAAFPCMARAAEPMDALTAIRTRRSVRSWTPEPVSDSDLQTMLEAAMLAPSAANEQPWDFVVVRNADTLAKIGELNHYASFARNAPLGILVCYNKDKEKISGMGILDVAMSAQNLMLAARALGLGSVFTGIFPDGERIKGFQQLFGLPQSVIPIGFIVIGHPVDEQQTAPDRFRPENIHQEKW